MPRLSIPTLVPLLAALIAPAAGADVVQCGPGIPPQVICLTGEITDTMGGGPLLSGKVYHLSGFPRVPVGEVLTIEAGAILKFHPNAVFENRGTLLVGAGAIFSSLSDDTAGGDTNADGPSTGSPGDWEGIVNYRTATLDMVDIRFAEVGFKANDDDTFLTGVTIEQCSQTALDLSASDATIVGCSFNDNDFAVVHARLDSLSGFVGNSASGNAQGDYVHVNHGLVLKDAVLGPQNSLDGRPFVVCQSIDILEDTTLELQPGTVIKFGTGPTYASYNCGIAGFGVDGTLLADGVIVTSLEDDTIGGDTAKDGLTLGTPGDWGYVRLGPAADATVLSDVVLRFGGQGTGINPAPAIDLLSCDATLANVAVTECLGSALRLNGEVFPSFPTVTGCSFTDNLGSAVESVPAAAVTGAGSGDGGGGFAGNAAAGNLFDVIEIVGGEIEGFVALDKPSSLNADGVFIVRGGLTVEPGAELELGAGVVLKWPATTFALDVSGTLTALGGGGEPVVLTSLKDDSIGGDTNKDGGATLPDPGDWSGVRLKAGSGASLLDGVQVRYAGRASVSAAAIEIASAATLREVVVELSETDGLDLQSFGTPAVIDCDLRDNGGVAVDHAIIRALGGFSGCTASGNALGDYIHVTNGDVSFAGSSGGAGDGGCTTEFGPDSGLAPDVSIVVDDDIDVPAGCQLSILGGAIVKFLGNRELDVDGTLLVGSVGGGTAVFTTALDDSVGGDTLKDGSTEGAPGAWQGIVISSAGTSVQDALVRFAGAFGVLGQTGIALQGANAQLVDVRVEDGLGAGLHLGGSSLPAVTDCELNRNDLAVDGVPIRALPGFAGCTAEDNKVGDYQRITNGDVTFDLLVEASQAVNGGVFVLADDVVVFPAITLTLNPNTTFKAEGTLVGFAVDGTLITDGPVTLTTLLDDINGDTNKDMDTTTPVPGSWENLDFSDGSDDSVLSGVRVRYAGSSGAFGNEPALRLDRADITVLDSTIERSGGVGMQLVNDARPEVRRTAFVDNLGVPINGASLGALAGFLDNTGTGNAPGDYVRVTSSALGGAVDVSRWNALNGDGVFVVDSNVQVLAPDVLTLRQGVILKLQGTNRTILAISGALNVAGTGLEPVVVTTIADDTVGGDTQKDGAATVPAPGAWARFELAFSAAPSTVQHLHARYGGGASFAAIELESALATARSIRADHSSTDGIRVTDHLGHAVNWVAFGNLADGIDLAGSGGFDVVHATAADNAGVGIRRNLGHVGSLWSSIAFANGAGQVTGYTPGEVLFSDAGPDFAGFDGNIDADPSFSDLPNGDLALGAGSPCVDAADLGAALGAVEDHREASRVLDDGFDGSLLPDMGAFERGAYHLAFGGEPRQGTVMSFTANGAEPGLALFQLGVLDGVVFFPPYGFSLAGDLSPSIFLGAAATGSPVLLAIPAGPVYPGFEFGVQGVGLPNAVPGLGQVTELYRGTIFP